MAPKDYMLNDKFPKHIKNATSTSDGLMSSEDKAKFDELFEFGLLSPVTPETDGIMIHEDKAKLDGIEEGANKYIHPDTHTATMIVEDSTHRFVSDIEKITWNAKASTDVVTTESNGLMSSVDKVKLDGIDEGANKYVHPDIHAATMIVEDSTHRFVTDTEKATWNAKATTAVVTTSANGLMSIADKKKLDAIEEGANAYVHPSSHQASMIVEDSTHRFVTDTEKATWNAKASTSVATQTVNGLMSFSDKKKLDNIEAGANTYVHPDTHPATIIVQDSTHRFVTDTEKATWNAKASTAVATTELDGLMPKDDKKKLDGIAANANNYTHPDTHPASIITQDANNRFVSDTEKATWNAKASTAIASTSANGLMSSTDKTKLNGIEEGAEVNTINSIALNGLELSITDKQATIPLADDSTYGAVELVKEFGSAQDNISSVVTYEFYTNAANAIGEMLDNIQSTIVTTVATTASNGLMSSTDKTKLNGIEEGANKYVHPTSHDASIITQDATHRFVTDTEKSTWNAKASTDVATTTANGLMIATDKVKLDGIAEGANKYTHPNTHAATMITEDTTHRFVTDEEKTKWNNGSSIGLATSTSNGLMSADDKAKLDGLSEGGDIPTSIEASLILQDENHRFVTDTEKATWNAKASTAIATQTANGLMSAADKKILDDLVITVAQISEKIKTAIYYG